ncbi:MAG: hypothetical protein QG656_715, partial [Candidatus Hydrogenedentes bacterium]|nr:hypothetical protein [Candidatus Hydrogenedentota bacterium]
MKEDRLPTLQYLDWPTLENVCSECSEIEREVLDAINREVAGAPSLDDVMNFMFDAFRKIGDCDRLSVAFLEEDNQRVVSHWTRTVYDDTHLTKGYSEDLRGSSLAHVLASGKPRVIGDMTQYLREHPDSRSTQLLVREGLHSSMTCPLIVEHRPVGFLFRSSLNANAYDEHQVRMHLAVAERLNQAVEKAYRIEQLAAANQAYFETLGFVSHELRSPLSSLVMDGEFLLSGIFGEMAEKQRDKVARMVEHGRYLLSLIDGYMDLAQVESHAMDTAHEEIDFVNAVVLDAVQTVQPQFEARRIV